MHFPPNDDDEDILAPDEEELRGRSTAEATVVSPESESTFAAWIEPNARSDRMTWSLVGLALVLAVELGVFGKYEGSKLMADGQMMRQKNTAPLFHQRADRLERLLFVYITNACGRFGLPSLFPEGLGEVHLRNLRLGFPIVPLLSTDDLIQQYWVEVASINRLFNQKLFVTKEFTNNLVQTGEYMNRLNELLPILTRWHNKLKATEMPKFPKLLLSLEVYYFRMYLNGLALQAVIEQWTTKAAGTTDASPRSPESTNSSHSSMYTRNEHYIREVMCASRSVLGIVVYDLLPDDNLKHAPVRAYFRIVSAAMFLLKSFAVGEKRGEVDRSLHLLDQTISALRTSVVDDVHLSLRIADLLERLTAKIRSKFTAFHPEHYSSSQSSPQQPASSGTVADVHSFTSTLDPTIALNGGGSVRFRQTPDALVEPNATSTRTKMPQSDRLTVPDSHVAAMPPPRGRYKDPVRKINSRRPEVPQFPSQTNSSTATNSQKHSPTPSHPPAISSTTSFQPQASFPTQSHQSSTYTTFPREEDWLALDLQNLLANAPTFTPITYPAPFPPLPAIDHDPDVGPAQHADTDTDTDALLGTRSGTITPRLASQTTTPAGTITPTGPTTGILDDSFGLPGTGSSHWYPFGPESILTMETLGRIVDGPDWS